MNKNHLLWAKNHNWGSQAILKDGTIKLWESYFYNDNQYFMPISFKSFNELRSWAGY